MLKELPAVEGARQDVYPSGMALDMGGGLRAYRWPPEGRPFMVDTFHEVTQEDYGILSSVTGQREWFNKRRAVKS
ncbi:hypothetical protein [Streptosporangium nondiastaticum]|uniref:hypothetical protein n=1 Tax=Streptosporangium nondiastaticum TaxID=35764 RepID=UPI0016725845|nr:hypothetical protein [Streptosporangium nondiastaticum]